MSFCGLYQVWIFVIHFELFDPLSRRFFHGDDKSGMARMDLIENAETDRIINGRFPGFIDNTIYRYKSINTINFHTYIHAREEKPG